MKRQGISRLTNEELGEKTEPLFKKVRKMSVFMKMYCRRLKAIFYFF